MRTETDLLKEFTELVKWFYPEASIVLQHCHIRLVTKYWGNPPQRLDYLALYCPQPLIETVKAHKTAFRTISHTMELCEPAYINASRLLRDPMSRVKESQPRLWLELHWLLSTSLRDC